MHAWWGMSLGGGGRGTGGERGERRGDHRDRVVF